MVRPFKYIEAIGKKYNKWTILDDSTTNWLAICECGKKVYVRRDFILRGLSKGCPNCKNKTHGLEGTSVYNIWAGMKQRCLNPNYHSFHAYGGRGIKVCERWLDFKNFYEDMGKPKKNMSLGRIDNDGDYCKENCRWETPKQQIRNRSNTKFIEYEGKKYSFAELGEKFNIYYKIIIWRLKAGWDLDRALKTPNRKAKK